MDSDHFAPSLYQRSPLMRLIWLCIPNSKTWRNWMHSLHYTSSLIMWNTLFSLLAVCITFFLPNLTYEGINFTAMAQNVIGSFLISFVSSLSTIKYQYYQTYILYDGMASGFCSVFTSFGQFIIQLDILFWNQHGVLKACFHFFATILLSFFAYWIGRKCALRMKKGVRFVKYMNKLEHDHERMQFEIMCCVSNLEKASNEKIRNGDASTSATNLYASRGRSAFPTKRKRKKKDSFSPSINNNVSDLSFAPEISVHPPDEDDPSIASPMEATPSGRSVRRKKRRSSSPSENYTSIAAHRNRIIHNQFTSQQRSNLSESFGTPSKSPTRLFSEKSPLLEPPPTDSPVSYTTSQSESIFMSPFLQDQTDYQNAAVQELEEHLHVQLDKQRRHTSKDLQPRDYAVIGTIVFVIVLVTAMVILAQVFQFKFLDYVVSSGSRDLIWFEYLMALVWSVLGAFCGRIIGGIGLVKKTKTVQWPTFRVNMLSCILIGSAHNILLFRHYFPYGDYPTFTIFFTRFIVDFCGSESSFCGLIDETTKLWQTKSISKLTAIQNFLYNLVFCIFVFLLVVYSVRIAFFYDLRLLAK